MTEKPKLIHKLLNNWYLKLLCIFAAFAIYIFYHSSLSESKTFIVPLTIIQNGAVISTGNTKQTVKVIIRSDAEHLASVHTSEIQATVNLNNFTKSGSVSVPVNITVPEEYLANDPFEVRAEPESIKLKVERKEVGFIKIEPSIVGEPTHGFEVAEVTVEPEFVEVVAAESILKATEIVNTTAIDISNARTLLTKEVGPVEFNNQLSIVDKGPYKVTVSFKTKIMDKTFTGISVYVNGLWPDLEVEGDVPTVGVTLEGAVNILEEYVVGTNNVVADLSQISEPGTYDIPLTFFFPSSVEVKSKTAETVSITVVQKKEVPEGIEEAPAEETTEATEDVKAE